MAHESLCCRAGELASHGQNKTVYTYDGKHGFSNRLAAIGRRFNSWTAVSWSDPVSEQAR